MSGGIRKSITDQRAAMRAIEKAAALGAHDSAYIPRNCVITITAKTSADVVKFRAEVEGNYQIVRFADVEKNSSLHFTAGGPASTRDINILLGKDVQAGRLNSGILMHAHWCRAAAQP